MRHLFLTLYSQLLIWAEAHPLAAVGLVIFILSNLATRLSKYPRAKGLVTAIRVVLDLVSVLPHKDSPDLFTLPGKRSSPPTVPEVQP